MLTTVKFGGSSLADAAKFRKVAEIIQADESRKYVVVSAPGKRFNQDYKITDLLYHCSEEARLGHDFSASFQRIRDRYNEIIRDLDLKLDLSPVFAEIEEKLRTEANPDYAASRGEYLSARVMAAYLDLPMIDAAEYIFFDAEGTFDAERTQKALSARLRKTPSAVLPGFYGSNPDGSVRTFSRGGSDVTGAIVARASASNLYENWTDVTGMLSCDPRLIENPAPIENISYAELRELAYMGASVLHESAIFPVKKAGIPINIRNTNAPLEPGTMIQPSAGYNAHRPVTGIAGKKHFSIIQIEKDQMNEMVGFAMRVLEIIARHGLLMEHMPSGIDTLSVVVSTEQLEPCRNAILHELQQELQPDLINISDELALIAIVGRGMVRQRGCAARVFKALTKARVNCKLIDQGSGELNIIVGVDVEDFEFAIEALYEEFFPR